MAGLDGDFKRNKFGKILDLIHKKKIDIEARLLFGIINFKETI